MIYQLLLNFYFYCIDIFIIFLSKSTFFCALLKGHYKEDLSLRVIFLSCQFVQINPNFNIRTTFLLVNIQIKIDFKARTLGLTDTTEKNMTFKLGSSLCPQFLILVNVIFGNPLLVKCFMGIAACTNSFVFKAWPLVILEAEGKNTCLDTIESKC